MNRKLSLIMILVFILCSILYASVSKSTRSEDTGINGVESKITETRTSKSEWLKDNNWIVFRTTNGKSANISVNKAASTFNNCKVVYSSAFASSSGEWSTGGIQVEALNHNAWDYTLSYSVKWK